MCIGTEPQLYGQDQRLEGLVLLRCSYRVSGKLVLLFWVLIAWITCGISRWFSCGRVMHLAATFALDTGE